MSRIEMVTDNITLAKWIEKHTEDAKTVVEMGAGFFDRLQWVHKNVEKKIGIEIYKPYIDNSRYDDCRKVHANVLNYKKHIKKADRDTAMMIDFLEHLERNVALDFIEDLKHNFRKILLMMPVGFFPHDHDVTGLGGDEYQMHRSYWYPHDIEGLEFNQNIICTEYYKRMRQKTGSKIEDYGCYFGVWKKNIKH